GLQTAHLIAVACSPSPDGHDHWTVRLLAQKAVELGFVTSISPTTIHELLKKTSGTRNLFVMVEPLAGWRHVEVTEQRTVQDYANVAGWLVHEASPRPQYIRLFQDTLNTPSPASLYETFPPAEARRLLQRVEFHYTPKHGSWLNMAEIEIAILERNALSRRLESEEALRRQVLAVETERNQQRRGIAWQFTSLDARHKEEKGRRVCARPPSFLSRASWGRARPPRPGFSPNRCSGRDSQPAFS